MFRAYQEVSPEVAQWILQSARREQEHRHWMDKEPLRLARRGQNYALSIAALVISIGGFLLYQGRPIEGFVAILVPLATLLGVFVYREVKGRRKSSSDSTETGSSNTLSR